LNKANKLCLFFIHQLLRNIKKYQNEKLHDGIVEKKKEKDRIG